MKLYHSTLHNLNPNRSSHSNTLKIILHISSIHHFITSLILFEHSWDYSNQPKQVFSIQLVRIYKTHIFCYSSKHKNIVSQWVKYHQATLDSRLQLYIEEPIEVSNYDTTLQILIPLDNAMELYSLWLIDYPRAHTSHYSLLRLTRYIKLLLGLPLVLGSYCILYIN